jgi:hypothetical protein
MAQACLLELLRHPMPGLGLAGRATSPMTDAGQGNGMTTKLSGIDAQRKLSLAGHALSKGFVVVAPKGFISS